jgi:hypothetical protein
MGKIIFDGQQSPFEEFPQVQETTVSVTDADTVRMTLKVDIQGKAPERCSVPILMNWKVAMELGGKLQDEVKKARDKKRVNETD